METVVLPSLERSDLKGTDMNSWVVPSVLIVDMERWRKQFNYTEYLAVIKRHPYKFLDEEAINYIFANDKIAFTELVYNVCTQVEDRQQAVRKAKLIHYGGSTKAWNNMGITLEADIWWSYAKRTGNYEKYLKLAVRNLWGIIETNKEKQRYKERSWKKYLESKKMIH